MDSQAEADRQAFAKAIARYQAKEEPIPEEIFAFLDKHFTERGILTRDKVETVPLNSFGRRLGTNDHLVKNALRHGGFSKYYHLASKIAFVYWKWKTITLTDEQIESIKASFELRRENTLSQPVPWYQKIKKPKYQLFFELDTVFKRNQIPTREIADQLPLEADGTKKGTSFAQMSVALKETDSIEYLSQIGVICQEYWGWKLPRDSQEDNIIEGISNWLK